MQSQGGPLLAIITKIDPAGPLLVSQECMVQPDHVTRTTFSVTAQLAIYSYSY